MPETHRMWKNDAGLIRAEFVVPGQAVPEPKRKAMFGAGEKAPITIWRKRVAEYAFKCVEEFGHVITGPIVLSGLFLFPRPKRLLWKKREMPRVAKLGTPDPTNLMKAVEDSANKILWKDDSQIINYRNILKLYCKACYNKQSDKFEEEVPRAIIRVEEVPMDWPGDWAEVWFPDSDPGP